jgi:hypothetical protein
MPPWSGEEASGGDGSGASRCRQPRALQCLGAASWLFRPPATPACYPRRPRFAVAQGAQKRRFWLATTRNLVNLVSLLQASTVKVGSLMKQLWNGTYRRETETELTEKEYDRLIPNKNGRTDEIKTEPPNKIHAHFPYVRLQEGLYVLIPCAREEVEITCLPFRVWSTLDRPFEREKVRYDQSNPVFATIATVRDEHDAKNAVACVHLGLVLATGLRLPAPMQSITYLVGHRQVTRDIGPLEREELLNPYAQAIWLRP